MYICMNLNNSDDEDIGQLVSSLGTALSTSRVTSWWTSWWMFQLSSQPNMVQKNKCYSQGTSNPGLIFWPQQGLQTVLMFISMNLKIVRTLTSFCTIIISSWSDNILSKKMIVQKLARPSDYFRDPTVTSWRTIVQKLAGSSKNCFCPLCCSL